MWSVLGGRKRGPRPYPGPVTPGEQRVLELLRLGMTNAQIAERLGISPDGVKYHVSNMLSKLGFDHREQLAAWDGEESRPAIGVAWWRAIVTERIAGGAVLAVAVASVLALLAWARPGGGDKSAVAESLTWAGEPLTLAGPSGSGWVIDDVRWDGGNVAVYYHPTDPGGQLALAIRLGTSMIGPGPFEIVGTAPNGLDRARMRINVPAGAHSVSFSPDPPRVYIPGPLTVILRPARGGDYRGHVNSLDVDWRVTGSNAAGDRFEVAFWSDPVPVPFNPVNAGTEVTLRDAMGRRYSFRSATPFREAPTTLSFDGPPAARAGAYTLSITPPRVDEPIPDLIIPLSAVAGTPP